MPGLPTMLKNSCFPNCPAFALAASGTAAVAAAAAFCSTARLRGQLCREEMRMKRTADADLDASPGFLRFAVTMIRETAQNGYSVLRTRFRATRAACPPVGVSA